LAKGKKLNKMVRSDKYTSKVIIKLIVLVTSMKIRLEAMKVVLRFFILMRDKHGGRNIRLISKVIPFFFFFLLLLLSNTLLRINT